VTTLARSPPAFAASRNVKGHHCILSIAFHASSFSLMSVAARRLVILSIFSFLLYIVSSHFNHKMLSFTPVLSLVVRQLSDRKS
jgi:hypothetical protein